MTPLRLTRPALYRAAQFFAALRATLPWWAGGLRRGTLGADDRALVNAILSTPEQQRLFARMLPNDQRHAMAVARTLQQAGYDHPALMQAALLHDVGKSLSQPIFHRVLIVLFEAFWPAALQWLSDESANLRMSEWPSPIHHSQIHNISWWRRPFVVHAQHPAIGAAWTEEAGCDPLSVKLIARHQDELDGRATEEQKLLAALQWADNLN